MTRNPMPIFLHIPKTGGTTLNSALTWQYLWRPTLWLQPSEASERWCPPQIGDLDERQRARLELVRGHAYYGVHTEFPGPTTYIALLRHPLWHVRSQYKYYEGGYWDQWSIGKILSSKGEHLRALNNTLVRWTSGVGFKPERCGQAEFERAKYNLENHFAVVGLTEKLGESLVLMKKALGWSRPLLYCSAKVHNQIHPRADLGDEACNLVLEHCHWNVKLYEWAKSEFKKNNSKRTLRKRSRPGPADWNYGIGLSVQHSICLGPSEAPTTL